MYCEMFLLLIVIVGASAEKLCSEFQECSPLRNWLEKKIQKHDEDPYLVPVYVPADRTLVAAWPNYEISYAVGLTAEGKEDDKQPKSQTVCHDFCMVFFHDIRSGEDYKLSLHHSKGGSIPFHAYIPKFLEAGVCNSKASFKWSMDSSLATRVCIEKLTGDDSVEEWRQKLIVTFKNSTEGGDRKRRSLWDGRTADGIRAGRYAEPSFNGVNYDYRFLQNPNLQNHGRGNDFSVRAPGVDIRYGDDGQVPSVRVGPLHVKPPFPIPYPHIPWSQFDPFFREAPRNAERRRPENSAQKIISPSIRKAPDSTIQINQREKFQNVHHLPAIERATNHPESTESHSSRNSSAFWASVDEESTSNTLADSTSYSMAETTLKQTDQGVCTNGRGNEIAFQNLDPETSYVAVIRFSNQFTLNVYFETRCASTLSPKEFRRISKDHSEKILTSSTPQPKQPPIVTSLPPLQAIPTLPPTLEKPLQPVVKCPPYISKIFQDYSWKAQPAGVTVQSKCPFPATGMAAWTCGHDGKWIDSIPDYSNCTVVPNYQEMKEGFLRHSHFNKILEKSKQELQNVKMAPGDIISTLELMANAHRRLESESAQAKVNESSRFMDWIITANNRLLTERKAWRGLRTRPKKISLNQIQRIVQNTAIDEISYIPQNTQKIYKKSALYVKIEKYKKKHYRKPENRKYCHPDKKFDPTCVTIPSFGSKESSKEIPVTVTAYSTLHCLFPSSAPCNFETNFTAKDAPNTAVMGATIGVSAFSTDKNNPVKLVFRHIFPGDKFKLDNKRCAWWNETGWSTSGCTLVRTDKYTTECNCYHLTNLAVIMDINGILEGHTHLMNLLKVITVIGCSISIICLALIILLLRVKNTLNPTTTTIHIHLCSTLLIAEIILLIGLDATFDKTICSVIAGLLLYFLLSTFCWSCAESAHIYFLFIKVFSAKRSYLCWFSLFAYIFPAIVVGVSVAITQGRGFGNHHHCWLSYESHLIWAFAGPVLCMLLVNVIVYLMTIRSFLGKGPLADRNASGQCRRMTRASLTLSTVLYLNWGLGFLYMVRGTEIMAFVFTFVNAFQGLLLFIVIVMFNQERVEYIKRKMADFSMKPKDGAVLTMKRSLPSQSGGEPDGTNSSSLVVRK